MEKYWDEFFKSGKVSYYLKYKKSCGSKYNFANNMEFEYGAGKSFGNGDKNI
jgi:hypothetical protein